MPIIVPFPLLLDSVPISLCLVLLKKIPLDVEMEVMLIEQGVISCQNYVKRLKVRLEWAYQAALENNQEGSEHHKKYYDRKMRCINLRPNDLVLVHVKAPTGDQKITD